MKFQMLETPQVYSVNISQWLKIEGQLTSVVTSFGMTKCPQGLFKSTHLWMKAALTSGAGEQAHNKKCIVVKQVLNKTNRTADTETYPGKGLEQWHFTLFIKLTWFATQQHFNE